MGIDLSVFFLREFRQLSDEDFDHCIDLYSRVKQRDFDYQSMEWLNRDIAHQWKRLQSKWKLWKK